MLNFSLPNAWLYETIVGDKMSSTIVIPNSESFKISDKVYTFDNRVKTVIREGTVSAISQTKVTISFFEDCLDSTMLTAEKLTANGINIAFNDFHLCKLSNAGYIYLQTIFRDRNRYTK
jgi:hypothetical protein